MTARTILTMSNGNGIDLLEPKITDIDFLVIAEHLAKDNRYCGATKDLVYSVAEHSVRCADAALSATADSKLAAYLLCHDMHEAFLGDDTTPKKRALQTLATRQFGILADAVIQTFDLLTNKFDIAIHEAAGLSWPPSPELRDAIKHWDKRLLATEWRDLMRCEAPYKFDVEPLPGRIDNHANWRVASMQFVDRCGALLPGIHVHQELLRRGEAS